MVVNMIVGYCKGRGIGKKNTIPWDIPQDLKHFAKLTKGSSDKKNIIVMGRRTWESLPKKPLPGRLNIILSNTISLKEENIKTFSSFKEILSFYHSNQNLFGDLWICGGYQVYKSALDNKLIDNLYITYIDQVHDCDAFFPEVDLNQFTLQSITPLGVENCNIFHYSCK